MAGGGGLQHFSVSQRLLGFGFGTRGFGAKGLGPGLDKNSLAIFRIFFGTRGFGLGLDKTFGTL